MRIALIEAARAQTQKSSSPCGAVGHKYQAETGNSQTIDFVRINHIIIVFFWSIWVLRGREKMQKFFSKFRTKSQPNTYTPLWALDRIMQAKSLSLDSLDLSLSPTDQREKLGIFPEEILKLSRISKLNLSHNRLHTFPDSINGFKKLTHLDLSYNELTTLPDSISRIHSLVDLNLSGNHLSALPDSIHELQNLRFLDLSFNQFSIFPDSIVQLRKLIGLNLNHNRLSVLPNSIAQLQDLINLRINGNTFNNLPLEIATDGTISIRGYFRQLDQVGGDFINEAKLLILGEGGVGKTTFAHKMLDSNYRLKQEDSTKGVDVLKWSFLITDNRQFIVNIWDFGGQEIYHATHQFFLSKHSLYALVADSRKAHTDFHYWLNIAELLSNSSPLLIIKNEVDDRPVKIDDLQLKGQFDNLKEILPTNFATNRGLEQVKEEVRHHLKKLPHIGSQLPKTWVQVREILESDLRNYVSLDEYQIICKQNGVIGDNDSLQLSSYLHDIGVLLHFQDEPLLKRVVILKPKWGTAAVYKVLDNKTVIQNLGRFSRDDLVKIWNAPEDSKMRDELLELMIKFKLCYEIPNQKDIFIAPQLLTNKQPNYEWDKNKNLLLRYSYEFMPKGILTQFIVMMHAYILEQKVVWRSGVVIKRDETVAEIIEHYEKRQIHVRIVGEDKKGIMAIIRHEFDRIHNTYKRLKYDKLIPCNCEDCKMEMEPHFYKLEQLQTFLKKSVHKIQCGATGKMVDVFGLLDDVTKKQYSRDKRNSPLIQNIYYGDHIDKGATKMTKINQTIKNATIHGSVVAAENIKESFNTIEKSNAEEKLKDNLMQLTAAVEAMTKKLPKEKAEKAAKNMKRLSEEATDVNPAPEWYNVSIDGLIAAAQNLGKVGDAVIELAGKVRKILTGGLL